MLICVIRSKVRTNAVAPFMNVVEPGFWELEVYVDMAEAAATGDPQGFVLKTIAEHLAGCVSEAGLPLGEKLWDITFTKFAENNFNFPGGFTA
jgi:hypothetical protein